MSDYRAPSILHRGMAALWLAGIGLVWAVLFLPLAVIALALRISPRRKG